MAHRPITVTALAATLAAGALFAAPASASNIAFGLSFGIPGLSVAVGTPAFAPWPAVVRPPVVAFPRSVVVRPRPVVFRPAVVAVPAPVVVRPRPVVFRPPVAAFPGPYVEVF